MPWHSKLFCKFHFYYWILWFCLRFCITGPRTAARINVYSFFHVPKQNLQVLFQLPPTAQVSLMMVLWLLKRAQGLNSLQYLFFPLHGEQRIKIRRAGTHSHPRLPRHFHPSLLCYHHINIDDNLARRCGSKINFTPWLSFL